MFKVTLRPWKVDDAEFSLTVRNHPDLMKWFRQDEPLTLIEQKIFIFSDLENGDYNGHIIMADKKPVGLCALKKDMEFCIGVLPEYQQQGIATQAMELLLKDKKGVWSEVFIGNPALEWYIKQFGFRIKCVKQYAYYKKDIGLIDIARIEHE